MIYRSNFLFIHLETINLDISRNSLKKDADDKFATNEINMC